MGSEAEHLDLEEGAEERFTTPPPGNVEIGNFGDRETGDETSDSNEENQTASTPHISDELYSSEAGLQATESFLGQIVFGRKRNQILYDFLDRRIPAVEAVVLLDSLEQEQDISGYLQKGDVDIFESLRRSISEWEKSSPSANMPADADLVASLTAAFTAAGLGSSGPKKRKDQEPPTLSEVNAVKWKTFRQGFELASSFNKWEDDVSVIKLRLSLKDEGARAIEHISFDDNATLEAALDRLEEVFVNPSGQDLAEVEFKRAKRKREETFQSFHIRLRNLFCRAYPKDKAETSKLLKDAFVLHLGDPDTSKQLRSSPTYRTYTYSDVLTRAQDILAASSLVRQAYPTSANGIHEISFDLPPEGPSLNLVGNGECFHCLAKGHLARDCPIADRIIKRIKENPKKYGLVKGNSSSLPPPSNPSQRQKRFVRKASQAPSPPLWGKTASNKGRGNYQNKWKGSGNTNATDQSLFAVSEDIWPGENASSPMPEDVAEFLQEENEPSEQSEN